MKKRLNIQTRQKLEEVIEANLNYLIRFATLRIGSKAEAEDLVYEAVIRILEADIAKIKPENIRMYLFRIVYNLCVDFHLTEQINRHLTVADNEIPDRSADETMDIEEIKRLNTLLDNLSEREAEVIRMRITDELSFTEISLILSIPASTVKSRFKSGMEKLRTEYLNNQ